MTTRSSVYWGLHVNKYHSKKSDGITEHIKYAINTALSENAFNVTVVQIFAANPRVAKISINIDEQKALKSLVSSIGIRIFAHHTYVSQPWDDDESIEFVHEELRVCASSSIEGLVIHLPKEPIDFVIPTLKKLSLHNGVKIYLETPAVTDKKYYDTSQKIVDLFDAIREFDPQLDDFGICIDTAHLWVCGQDISSYNKMEKWLQGLDSFPKNNIIFHCNDSAKSIGKGPDAHAGLGKGYMWDSSHESGLAYLVKYIKMHSIPLILERKPKEILNNDYNILLKLSK